MAKQTVPVRQPAGFKSVRQAWQVCLLPLMDPAVQFTLVTSFALATAHPSPAPMFTVDVNAWCEGRPMTMSYQLDLLNRRRFFSGQGHVLGQTVESLFTLSEDVGLRLHERMGCHETRLVLCQGADGSVSLGGDIDRVTVQVRFDPIRSGDRLTGFLASGQIGRQPYAMRALMGDLENRRTHLEGRFEARGSIGEYVIAKDYSISSVGADRGEELLWTGSGSVGDIHQRLMIAFSVIP